MKNICLCLDTDLPSNYVNDWAHSPELMKLLKSNDLMNSGDLMEVEIRGCSIEAISRIVSKINEILSESGQKVNDIQIDNFLWSFRREKAKEMEKFPYHRVRSIYY